MPGKVRLAAFDTPATIIGLKRYKRNALKCPRPGRNKNPDRVFNLFPGANMRHIHQEIIIVSTGHRIVNWCDFNKAGRKCAPSTTETLPPERLVTGAGKITEGAGRS